MRATSKHSTTSDIMEKAPNKELHLSGSLIRSFVRQLSSSRSKEIVNPDIHDGKVEDASSQNLSNFSVVPVEPQQQKSDLRPSTQYKKQVRRRNHTSKPYQERVINMAEARREIVSALKLHRAVMKSSGQLQKQELLHSVRELSSLPSQMPNEEFLDQMTSRRDTGICPPSGATLNCFNTTYFPSSPRASNCWNHNVIPARFKHTGHICPRSPSQVVDLNFHGLNNVGAPLSNNTGDGGLPHHCMPSKQWDEIPGISYNSGQTIKDPEEIVVDKLHPVMNEDEIAAIRLIGEQHDIEWNDRMNLSTTAWWCSILKNMERTSQEKDGTNGTMDDTGVLVEVTPQINSQLAMNGSSSELRTEGIGEGLFDEMTAIPTWVNYQQVADETKCQGSHFQDEASSWIGAVETEADGVWCFPSSECPAEK